MPLISIYIPTYNGSSVLTQTLESILNQSFNDFEIIITDDKSTDDTEKIIKAFDDTRIKFFSFHENVGYAKNLQRCVSNANGEIIFLFSQDDILGNNVLQKIKEVFSDEKVGVATRPFFWFDADIKKPVRLVKKYQKQILDSHNPDDFVAVIKSVGQLSGLAYRREYLNGNLFSEECFVAHVYPFMNIFKNYKCAYLSDYTVAVRIKTSQTRFLSNIYEISPLESWVKMINKIFPEKEFKESRKAGLKHATTHFVGLAQLKNYANLKYLWREYWLHIKYRPLNLFNIKFWFFVLITATIPRFILRKLTDWYKEKINSKTIPAIKFS